MNKNKDEIDMYELLGKLAPLERTLASNANDTALEIIKKELPTSIIEGYPTGSKVWTWTIPKRWEVVRAKLMSGNQVIADHSIHPMHVISYSNSFKGTVTHEELQKHLWSNPNMPDAIPWVFKYYEKTWGFSIQHNKRNKLNFKNYEVDIETKFLDGKLNILYDFLQGETNKTFIICSNICHPTQVNDSLTGVAVGIDIFKRLQKLPRRKYSYLFLAVPEQIGSIAFFANNPKFITSSIGGFFSEMLGTSGPMVGQKTRDGNHYLDFLMEKALSLTKKEYRVVPFLRSAANDEKVMDSPGVDIPSFSITRQPYPEYHTSEDNMSIIKNYNLQESRDVLQQVLNWFEEDYIPQLVYPGPIFLAGHDLYPNWYDDPSLLPIWNSFIDIMPNIDGRLSVVEIAKKINCNPDHVFYWCNSFFNKQLITKKDFYLEKPDSFKK